jgi:hypothetical protein
MDGLELFKVEHRRRVADGFDVEWAMQWKDGELLEAAMCYIRHARHQVLGHEIVTTVPKSWPLRSVEWAPNDSAMGNIKIAGALLAIEWDRVHKVEMGR